MRYGKYLVNGSFLSNEANAADGETAAVVDSSSVAAAADPQR
jgi:hypothetical protein